MEHTPLFRFTSMDAKTVARAGFRATMAGRRLVMPGLTNKLLAFSSKVWPRQWVVWATGKLHPLP
jgi:short-subunit dehydrogenase